MRPATLNDWEFLLKLKNDPVMRKFAVVTHKKIRKKDHLNWLKDHIDEIQIIGNKQGMFRISKDGEVSINIAPQFRGQGLGSKVLKDCPKGCWAKIIFGNVPSMRLFLSNGFKIVDTKDNYYILKN